MTRWTTGHLKPESSQDKPANTRSRMGGRGDDYAVVHEAVRGERSRAVRLLPVQDDSELSWGNGELSRPAPLHDLQLVQLEQIDSGYRAMWAGRIGGMLDQGWRTAYSDGSGRGNHHAAASHSTSRREEQPTTTHTRYLGTLATVADAELEGLALSLKANRGIDMLLLLTDSMAACNTVKNLAKGAPPRSQIEIDIAEELAQRRELDTGISWVRSHIGIPGNEIADQAACFQSHVGEIAGLANVATQEGLRAYGKDIRKGYRQQASYGKGRRPLWGRKALSAYTWMRCNKGPHREWLYRLGKIDSPLCDCREVT